MSIKFNVSERVDPRDVKAQKKFYPITVSSGEINLKQISNRISQMCTVNRADVLAVLDALVQVMQEELADGNIVKLGDFGSFSVGASGTGSDNKEDVTALNVTGSRIRFKPGVELRKMQKLLTFEKADS